MNQHHIVPLIKEFFEETFPNPGAELTESTDLFDDWLEESLSIIRIIAFIEQTFGIEVKDGDISGENFETIACISNYVTRQLGNR